jgi:predicted secreted protein
MEGKHIQKKLIILILGFILLCITFSGCNQQGNSIDLEEKKFIGTWKTTSEVISINWTITLFSDGSCIGAVPGNTWALQDGKLVFMTTTQNSTVVGVYNYVFSTNTTLSLTDVNTGVPKVYTKQESNVIDSPKI